MPANRVCGRPASFLVSLPGKVGRGMWTFPGKLQQARRKVLLPCIGNDTDIIRADGVPGVVIFRATSPTTVKLATIPTTKPRLPLTCWGQASATAEMACPRRAKPSQCPAGDPRLQSPPLPAFPKTSLAGLPGQPAHRPLVHRRSRALQGSSTRQLRRLGATGEPALVEQLPAVPRLQL